MDDTALLGFLGLAVGGVLAFAREQVKWYQDTFPRLEKILTTQQETLEKMHADAQAREDADRLRDEELMRTLEDALTTPASGGQNGT